MAASLLNSISVITYDSYYTSQSYHGCVSLINKEKIVLLFRVSNKLTVIIN